MTTDNQKKYEEAAKLRYPLNNGAEYDPECAKWQDHAVKAFLAGASFAEKEKQVIIDDLYNSIEKYHLSDNQKDATIKQLQEENQRLKEALNQIAYPIKHAQIEAEKAGAQLDGHMAVMISNDPAYLQGIAQNALKP